LREKKFYIEKWATTIRTISRYCHPESPINKNQQLRQKQAETDYNRMETIWPNLLIGWTKLQQTETNYKPWIGLRNQRSQVKICLLEKEQSDIFEKLLMMAKI